MLTSLFSLLLPLLPLSGAWDNPFSATVATGLDTLVDDGFSELAGKKIIILSNPTGVTASLDLGVDVMHKAGVDLVGVMGPEHGFRGTAQAGSGAGGSFTDPDTGLTVYDAYNANTSTLVSYIKESGADTVVFDIQDVGARFYTYTWAMYDTFVASALCNTTFILLDRPNPITGLNSWGPILNETFSSYVGRRGIAQAHGMTSGELAMMFKGQGWISDTAKSYSNLSVPGVSLETDDIKLQVVKMKGWERWMSWENTGLPWVLPSPNMATPITASIYPGNCMFEGTNLSEGRGTVKPFELLGAGYITNSSWSNMMRSLNIPDAYFRPACFQPTTSKWLGATACGLQTYLTFCTDVNCASSPQNSPYETFDPVHLGVSLLWGAKNLYSNISSNSSLEFEWLHNPPSSDRYDVDTLSGGTIIREGIDAGMTPDQIRDIWTPDLEAWKSNVRSKYLMY